MSIEHLHSRTPYQTLLYNATRAVGAAVSSDYKGNLTTAWIDTILADLNLIQNTNSTVDLSNHFNSFVVSSQNAQLTQHNTLNGALAQTPTAEKFIDQIAEELNLETRDTKYSYLKHILKAHAVMAIEASMAVGCVSNSIKNQIFRDLESIVGGLIDSNQLAEYCAAFFQELKIDTILDTECRLQAQRWVDDNYTKALYDDVYGGLILPEDKRPTFEQMKEYFVVVLSDEIHSDIITRRLPPKPCKPDEEIIKQAARYWLDRELEGFPAIGRGR